MDFFGRAVSNAIEMSAAPELRSWPNKVTREDARAAKAREREFFAALKAEGKRAGWRFARADIFRQEGRWFISNMPTLAWQRGVWNRLTVKPMALDPLFWEIVDLPDNNSRPLSFRATGAWVLRPEWIREAIATEEDSPLQLADRVLEWSNQQLGLLSGWSTARMLAELGPGERLHHQQRSLAICLHLLNGDLDKAEDLCRAAGDQSELLADGGGFTTNNSDGTRSTFNKQALRWIASRRG